MIGHCNPTLRSAVNDADACRWLFDDKRYPVVPADASGCPRCRRHVHFFFVLPLHHSLQEQTGQPHCPLSAINRFSSNQ